MYVQQVLPVLVSVFFARRAKETRIASKFTRTCPNFSPPVALREPSGEGAPARGAPRFRLVVRAAHQRTTCCSTNYNPAAVAPWVSPLGTCIHYSPVQINDMNEMI